ncbi:MAG: class I SAM-dependent methyltransferase [Candidatus Acidiferrales bacterium]
MTSSLPVSAAEHYENLLADHYEWMFGLPFEAKVAEQQAILDEVIGKERASGLAVDLGCGSGFQSFALSDRGYEVIAIDTSEKLLRNLSARVGSRNIAAKHADLRELDSLVRPASAEMAVCMGDTLTHLPGRPEVSRLFQSVARALKPGGKFVVNYRDLASGELFGLDRFIPVRSDDRRVMTCFLEYETAETVIVHDLINLRDDAGNWTLHKSSYRKLRLPSEWVVAELSAAGLSISGRSEGRMVTIAATRNG